ncbi:MAG TPA: cellulose synthase subunit BcsC-related outer membrane protein [Burkholderiaceae bacterium]|nr:cellulose synthase subunit BcsC-related outer membrane protein [Burkholderiaceae bacterium]
MRRTLIPAMLGIGAAVAHAATGDDAPLTLRLSAELMGHSPAHAQIFGAGPATALELRRAEALSLDKSVLPPFSSRTPARDALLDRARLWQSRNRDDLAAEALNRLLAMSPQDPDALAQLAMLQLRLGQKPAAKATLAQLRRVRPDHPDIPRIVTLIRLEEEDRNRLREARLLARAGKPEQALAALRVLYPDGPPTGDLAFEYWQLVADTRGGWERALAGLRHLVASYPDNLRYRLALAGHITIRRPADAAALKVIRELVDTPALQQQARTAWRKAMLRLGPMPSSVPLIEQYLARETIEDQGVKEHLARLQAEIERQRRLLTDPYYRAQREGLALLDKNRLDDAEERLRYAAQGRPGTPDVLGGLGLICLRQGRHAEAQAYFSQAARSQPNRWSSLLKTAQFWGLMRMASDAMNAGDPTLAERKLREAGTLDAREPAALTGLAQLQAAQGRQREAEEAYRAALALEPANAGAIQGLATLLLRDGRSAAVDSLLVRVTPSERRGVDAALDAAHAAVYKERAEALLSRNDTVGAASLLEQAARHDRDDPWLRYDLARLYGALGQHARGEALFDELLAHRPADPAARYAHALYLSGQERRVEALTTLERIAVRQRDSDMASLQRRLWMAVVAQRAEALTRQGNAPAAHTLLAQAEQAARNDRGLLLDIAEAWLEAGDTVHGYQLLIALADAPPPSFDWGVRHVRLLASAGGDNMAPFLLERLQGMASTPQQQTAIDDVHIDLALRAAARLRAAGQPDQALNALIPWRRNHPRHERLLAAEARILRTLGRRDAALSDFEELSALQPGNRAYFIARIELLIEARRFDAAHSLIDAQCADLHDASADHVADLVGALRDLGDASEARRLADTGLQRMPDQPRLLALAAELAWDGGSTEEALALQQHAVAAAHAAQPAALSILSPSPDGQAPTIERTANASATATDYSHRHLAELLDASATWVAGAADIRTRSGAAGTSAYHAAELPFEWKGPQSRDGRWTYRAEIASLDAGTLDLSAASASFGSALLCNPACDTGTIAQRAHGLVLDASLDRNGVRYDLGTTPLGFPVQSIVGGMLLKGDIGPLGYSLDVSRRPLTGSLLSYAGQRDPRTGQVWGGVRATGVRLGASLDDGGTLGLWSSFGLHHLTGTNVLPNDRLQIMSGAIWRVVNDDDTILQFGLTGMHWRLRENAGEYTFGHGGYYSPQRYTSLSLPVTFGRRFARLSYAVRASISASRSDTASAAYFPTDAALQAEAVSRAADTGVTPFYAGGAGRGTGYSLALAGEYQATSRLFMGTRLERERSPDYAPNRFTLYLRYALGRPSARPVPLLPEPTNPVSQY